MYVFQFCIHNSCFYVEVTSIHFLLIQLYTPKCQIERCLLYLCARMLIGHESDIGLMSKRIFVLIIMLLLLLFIISSFSINSVFGPKPNKAPVADAGGPYSGTEGMAISFDGSGSFDQDGTIASYFWDFGDGQTSTELNPTHIFTEDGTHSVSLTVTDDKSASDEDISSAVIDDADPVADFYASSTSGTDSLTVTFSDNSTSYDGIISWLWEFGDGELSTEQNPTHLFTIGSYTVTLTVEEEDGDSNIQNKPNFINIESSPNSSPIADFAVKSSVMPAINETISFIDNSTDKDGNIISWSWNFGDSTISTNQNPSHSYQKTGTYQVTLTVKDDDGAVGTTTKEIIIHEITPPETTDNYDGLWHNIDFTINLTATDEYSGVAEIYYRINNGSIQQLSINGQPRFTTEGTNNTLEYWSIDNAGNEELHHMLLGIKLDKTPPNAIAGQDITIDEDTIVTFDANSSSDNIQITNYTWIFLDNKPQQIQGENPQYVFHTPGVYTVTLDVTDAALNSGLDTITITVIDVTPPKSYAGDDEVLHQETTLYFDGSASTDNIEVVSYIWEFDDDDPQTLLGANPTYTFDSPGVYEITLTVWDAQGNFGTDIMVVTVIDTAWPVANAGPDQVVDENSWVYLDGSASSDNLGIDSFVWTFIDGDLQTLDGMNVEYYFETPDDYLVTLTVSDAEGHSSDDTLSIIVRDNTAPVIEIEYGETVVENNPISFDASRSWDNTRIVSFNWVFGDGTVENTSVPTIIHIYDDPGTYNVELFAKDVAGNVNRTMILIVVQEDTDGDLLANHLDEDDDGDGMPDEWESFHDFDSLDPSDAVLDSDGDGLNNVEEYRNDTNPRDYESEGHILADVLVVAVIVTMAGITIMNFKYEHSKR